MKNKSLYIIFCALFILNIFLINRYLKLKKTILVDSTISNSNGGDGELQIYKSNFNASIFNNNLKLDNLLIIDSLNISHSLKKEFNKEKKYIFIYRFSKNHCESCVVKSLEVFTKWVESKKHFNAMILGSYDNNRIFYRNVKDYNIGDVSIYNSNNFDIPIEDYGYPYFFVLENNMKIHNVFIPDKEITEITLQYLDLVNTRYFDKI